MLFTPSNGHPDPAGPEPKILELGLQLLDLRYSVCLLGSESYR